MLLWGRRPGLSTVARARLLCAILWRERQKSGRAILNTSVTGAFLLAVTLLATRDVENTQNMPAVTAKLATTCLIKLFNAFPWAVTILYKFNVSAPKCDDFYMPNLLGLLKLYRFSKYIAGVASG
jgi:hypothetical protein